LHVRDLPRVAREQRLDLVGPVRHHDDVDPGRRDIDARQFVHQLVDLDDDHTVVESGRLDNGRRVFGVRAGVEVALAIGLLGADQRHVGHQVHEHPGIQLDIRVNGADLKLAVLKQLGQANALRTGVREIELAGDASLEQRQVLRSADAPDQQVHIMGLRRIDLDERPRQEIGLLLVVAFERHGVPGLQQRLQGLGDRPALQHRSLHPGRDPGQSRGLLGHATPPIIIILNRISHSDTHKMLHPEVACGGIEMSGYADSNWICVKGLQTGSSACPPACYTTPAASAATTTFAPTTWEAG
jgi:hypothetical protein